MSTLKGSFRLPNPRLALWRHLSIHWQWKKPNVADCVSQRERERHHREPPVVQQKGYSLLKISDALNSCGHPFLSCTLRQYPLGGKKKSNPPNQEKSSKCTIITVILTIHSCYWKAAANLYEVCMWEDRELADIPEGSFNPAREGIRWIAHQHQHNQQQLSHVILINRSTRTNYRTSI